MLRPVGKPRVAAEIVEQLRGLILRGEYAAGDKLPPERRLAEELGVNRASLREAIKSLEQLGLVRTRQGDGTRVLDFMQTAGIELLSHLIDGQGGPDLHVLRDVVEFRCWFGQKVARLAAERATAADRERLAAIAASVSAPGLPPDRLLQLDFDFYVALTQIAQNRVLMLLINSMRGAVLAWAPFFAQLSPSPGDVATHHLELLAALADHDGDRAAASAATYLAPGGRSVAAPSPS